MSLLEEAQALAKRPGGTCGVALLVRRLDETEQTELLNLIWSKDDYGRWAISAAVVSDTLAAHQWMVDHQVIARHRAGRCRCP